MRGSWVGALSSWCHCLLESGGTLPLQGDAAQPLWLTPRMAGVATAHLLLLDNFRETSTEKRKKREEEEGAHHRKTSPTPLPRELERDARGLERQSGQGWVTRKNRQGKVGLRGTLACWHSGLRAVAQVRVCSSQTRRGSDLAGSVWPLWALTSLVCCGPLGSDLTVSVVESSRSSESLGDLFSL